MKLLTKDTDYAVRALIHIATSQNKTVSVTELTNVLQVPRPFLRKILQILSKNNICQSIKGKGGGFRLVKGGEKVSLITIIKIFKGEIDMTGCTNNNTPCFNITGCTLRVQIKKIERHVLTELRGITIASLVKSQKNSHCNQI